MRVVRSVLWLVLGILTVTIVGYLVFTWTAI